MSSRGRNVQELPRRDSTRLGDGFNGYGPGEPKEPTKTTEDGESETDSETDEDEDYEPDNEPELEKEQYGQLGNHEEIEERWDHIMEELKGGELKQDVVKQEEFFTKHKTSFWPHPDWALQHVPIQKRNVLFRLAQDRHPELPHLVKLLVKEYPPLLEDADSGRRALDIALDKTLDWFIRAVLDSDIEDADLIKALTPIQTTNEQTGSQSNCVHKAINSNLDPFLTEKLIERASSDLLTAKDEAGYTPLHYAVRYKKFTEGLARVVNTLLRCGDAALDEQGPPPHFYSPFRYYMQNKPSKKRSKEPADESKGNILQKTKSDREQQKPGKLEKPMLGANEGEKKRSEEENKDKDKGKGKEEEKGKVTPTNLGMGLLRSETWNTRLQPPQANERRLIEGSAPSVSELQAQEHLSTPPNGSVTNATTKRARETSKPTDPGQSSKSSTKKPDVEKSLKLAYFRSIFNPPPGDDRKVRNHASAEEFLYGDNKECRAISFQFPPVHRTEPEKVDFGCFKDSYKRFEFDRTLLYVDFGKFKREWPDDPRSVKQRLLQGPGRRDLVDFFTWLNKDKDVKNIMKVSVDDEDDIPHCDEAIVASLKRFNFEILDWRKIDLCPLAIQQACRHSPNLRELHLCWSGNNAILRSWSAPGGLACLLALEKITIYETKLSLDSPERTTKNLENFEADLNDARQQAEKKEAEKETDKRKVDKKEAKKRETDKKPDPGYKRIEVTIRRYDALYGYAHGIQNPLGQGAHRAQSEKKIDEHQWLDIMDTFAGAVRKVQEEKLQAFPEDYLKCQTLPKELSKDVTVALIDDGVDFMHPAISKNLMGGKSFDSGFGPRDRLGSPAPFHGSETGHGTFMAYMIQRVCPSVKIFVYKLDVLGKDKYGDAVTFTAKNAADAVQDAVERGFDIISMSWSIQKNDSTDEALNNTKHLERLKESLAKASKDATDSQGKKRGKETLLFCSAPDTGMSSLTDTHYPFNCADISKIFRIGAAQATGKAYPWVGKQIGYILPGENVGMKPSDMVRPNEDKVLRTGSSVATALAAGLAAMIIHCVRLGAVYNFHKNTSKNTHISIHAGVSERTVRAIKTFDGMKAAFENISKNDYAKGDKRLEVETFFKSHGKELSKEVPKTVDDKELWKEDRWSTIANIAHDLLPSNRETEFGKA